MTEPRDGAGDAAPAVAIIVGARELVLSGWCRGADARDGAGRSVDAWDPAARSWSLIGAIVAAVDLPAAPSQVDLGPLRRALGSLAEVIDEASLSVWNDDPARSQKDVAETLERARRLCVARG